MHGVGVFLFKKVVYIVVFVAIWPKSAGYTSIHISLPKISWGLSIPIFSHKMCSICCTNVITNRTELKITGEEKHGVNYSDSAREEKIGTARALSILYYSNLYDSSAATIISELVPQTGFIKLKALPEAPDHIFCT